MFISSTEILSELVTVLADLASCNLRTVTTYMEDIHKGEDINKLYMQAKVSFVLC